MNADGVDVAVEGWCGSDFKDREAGVALVEQVDEHSDFVVGEGVVFAFRVGLMEVEEGRVRPVIHVILAVAICSVEADTCNAVALR